MRNRYPKWLIEKVLYKKFVDNNYNWPDKQNVSQSQDSQMEIEFVCIPFTRGTSQAISRSIRNHTFGSNTIVKIAFSPGPKLSSIFNTHKDKFKTECGIYEARCLSCISVYVGEAGQPLKLRAYQHLNAIRNVFPFSNCITHSRLQLHTQNRRFEFPFTKTRIEKVETKISGVSLYYQI
ncbi:unnamed protein product [Orchesella dallaii]|uniref:GIY-YIG domain-containing protein n=1 Tax=Orchesella dallaii TaxID=48710 RepID=A0ABP1PZ69_9HEXA